MNNALSKKRLFLDHPSPKGFCKGALYIPPKSGEKLSHISPKTQAKVLSKSFSGDSFRKRKESPENDLDSTRSCGFWGRWAKAFIGLWRGAKYPSAKGFCRFCRKCAFHFKKETAPRPKAHGKPQIIERSSFLLYHPAYSLSSETECILFHSLHEHERFGIL